MMQWFLGAPIPLEGLLTVLEETKGSGGIKHGCNCGGKLIFGCPQADAIFRLYLIVELPMLWCPKYLKCSISQPYKYCLRRTEAARESPNFICNMSMVLM